MIELGVSILLTTAMLYVVYNILYKEKPMMEVNEENFIKVIKWQANQKNREVITIDVLNRLISTPTARQVYLEYHEKYGLYEQCELIKKHLKYILDKISP